MSGTPVQSFLETRELAITHSQLTATFLHAGRQKCREDWPNPTLESAFTVLLDLLLLMIPLTVMAFAYINITVTLRKGIRENEKGSNGKRFCRSRIGVVTSRAQRFTYWEL